MEEVGKIDLKTAEVNTLMDVRDVLRDNLDLLRHGTTEELIEVAENIGYKVVKVKLGETFTNIFGGEERITRGNMVRIGDRATLIVGTFENGETDVADLRHDVGACLAGGKIVPEDRIPNIRLDTIREVVRETAPEYRDNLERGISLIKGVKKPSPEYPDFIDKNERGEETIAHTTLMDAIIQGIIKYEAIEKVGLLKD